jgi:DHA1 family L-arabinose/isopropyl-beta-D-thiogalactopyranoside export protein-like MFS transporter
MSNRSFFLASLAWNLGHGMSWMALPLYAAAQGLPNAEIGALVALPVLAQAPLNLAGGAYTDRIGGRRIMMASTCAMAFAGAWLTFANGFWMLIIGQLGLALSRAVFWPATWALASELPGGRGVQLGRLNAVTNFGQIGGNVLCGVLLVVIGFPATFTTLAVVAVVSFVAAMNTEAADPKPSKEPRHVLAGFLPLLHKRIVYYSILCAYLSAVPFALSLSFFPLLLVHYGFNEGVSGVLLALRSVGSIAAALIASRFVRSGPETLWPVWCGFIIALAVGFLPLTDQAIVIGMWLLIVGVGSGAMTLYFQITISEASRPEQRGSALALGGTGWNISLLTTPLAMGFLADHYGLVASFYFVGGLTLACAGALAALRQWSFKPSGAGGVA